MAKATTEGNSRNEKKEERQNSLYPNSRISTQKVYNNSQIHTLTSMNNP